MAHSLDLRAFIMRARVLKLYRQALRTARRAPIHARGEVLQALLLDSLFYKNVSATLELLEAIADDLRQTMRQEMEKSRYCDDKPKVRFLMSEGLRRLKELEEMLDMQGHS